MQGHHYNNSLLHVFSFKCQVLIGMLHVFFLFLGNKSTSSHLEALLYFRHGCNHSPQNQENPASTHRRTKECQEREVCCIDQWCRASAYHVFEQDPEYFQDTRTVRIPKCYMDFNTLLLLLGLSAGHLASCSSVPSRVLVVNPLCGTALFVSVWMT